ncbi:MAG: lysophospholipid acyltransferase family protein [Candidatus Binatia bacterium]
MAAELPLPSSAGSPSQPSSPTSTQARRKKIVRPSRKKKGRAMAYVEYLLLRGFFSFFRLLPFRVAFSLGERLGWLLYFCDWPHRRIGLINLALAFPHKSKAEHRKILRASFRNLGRLIAEFCHLHSLTGENVSERIQFADVAQWQGVVEKFRDTGALILTAHFGSWELLAYAHACYGFPVHIIHRRLHNPWVDEFIARERERCGNRVIRKTTAGIEVLRAVRQKAVIVFALDQNASGRMGVFVPFFSRLASTSSGLAGLALAYGMPVVPVFPIREGGTWHHRIVLLPPIEPVRTGDQEADLRATTAKFAAVFQQMVEQYPDHWLWIHRRWKRRPEGEAPIY